MNDVKGALALPDALPPAELLIANKGHDADWFRGALAELGIVACIPARRGRKHPADHDESNIANGTGSRTVSPALKDWPRIATRYDRRGELFLSAVYIAATVIFLVKSPGA
jgi:transposase